MTGKLYIDLGNSRIKWMRENRQGCSSMQAADYKKASLRDTFAAAWKMSDRPEQVWVASVADRAVEEALAAWLTKAWGLSPQVMKVTAACCGLTCGYEQPQQLGVDRWAAMIAAYRSCPDGVCVVDCGTAVTLDVVNSRGQHLGGYILPGVKTMQRALLQNTAIEMQRHGIDASREWGDSTASCIELGTGKSIVALIEQSIERMQAAGICDPGLILTGGEVELIEPLMQIGYQRHDALVLEGIRLYAREHSS